MGSWFDPWRTGAVALDVLAAGQAAPADLAERRQRRLAALLAAAGRGSAFYRERLREGQDTPLTAVAPVTKRELMDHFDTWVTDPRLRLSDLRAFIADPANIGRPFKGDFVVWESSGSSGQPGTFVQDAQAMAVYDALEAWRRMPRWFDPWCWTERIASVGATGGHFATAVSMARLRRLNPGLAAVERSFSFLQPTPALVEQINRHAPTIVCTYPTVAVLLAEEAAAGRLRVAPREVWTGGETLTPGMRRFIEHQFGCVVVDSYGASECLAIASQCRRGALHLNSDWVILEPVDEHLQPVPPGVAGFTTLLTNLANHVQPVIRYDLGDRVVLHPRRCACGSALPVINVEGRCDDTLVMHAQDGHVVRLLPLALSTVLEDEAGVFDFRIVQLSSHALRLSLGGDEALLAKARGALAAFLRQQGLPAVHIETDCGGERPRGRTGKLQRIVARRGSA